MENPFTVDLQSFLIERIHNLDFSAISPEYRKTTHEITKLSNLLKPSLSEEALKTITKLDDGQTGFTNYSAESDVVKRHDNYYFQMSPAGLPVRSAPGRSYWKEWYDPY